MFTGTLHPYQVDAVQAMVDQGKMLVAYEMGLGKTPMTIAAIEELIESGKAYQGIIVVNASLKYQWARQISKFTNDANVLVVDGTKEERYKQYEAAIDGQYEYVILNYEQVVNDWDYVRRLPRDFMVCDEVTAIKSFTSKRSRRIKKLQAPYKYGLTGTPVENKPEELYSILQWLEPSVLGRFDYFDKTFIVRDGFGGVKFYKNLPLFHKRVSSIMVRKTQNDEDVKPYLPTVSDPINHYVIFDPASRRVYKKIAKELQADLVQAATSGTGFDLWRHYNGGDDGMNKLRGQIMSKLGALRMLCDHPELLRISAKAYGKPGAAGSAYAADLYNRGLLDGLKVAPKMNHCVDTINEILGENDKNKVVLFAFYKPLLRIIQKEVDYSSVIFDGDMDAKQKDAAKQEFESNPDCRIFLSSDAGGYGVDLPSANYLINYDLPWSAGKLAQRNSRIIRASSEWGSVFLLNMVINGSIEDRLLDMLMQKKAIAAAILDGKYDKDGRIVLTLDTLTNFLDTATV